VIDNDEITRFRKEKLPMYVGIVHNSIAAQELYECNAKKRQLLINFKKLNKEYEYENQKLFDEFQINQTTLIKQLDQLNKTIEKLKQITEKEKGC
jgi:hypothetical protein